jgi:PBP1b-binding outer membrane lipoprotein LpoB
MKKNLILISILSLVFTGCVVNNQPKVAQEEKKVEPIVQEPVVEEIKEKPKKVSNKKITYTYYRLIPSKIEVFAYNKLSNNTIIDDRKLKNSFYLNGDKIRIEKIYTSKVGDKYGKIAGKYLIVSMDDLKKD